MQASTTPTATMAAALNMQTSARRSALSSARKRRSGRRRTMSKWTKDEMTAEFDVLGFFLGWCCVRRKSDGVEGTLDFYRDDETNTRIYHNFLTA